MLEFIINFILRSFFVVPLTDLLLSSVMDAKQLTTFIIVVIILIFFSALFSASETAFSSTNVIKIRKLADENAKGARKAQYILDHYDKALSTILVANNLANIANTTVCAYLFSLLILNPTMANVANTIIMTVLILIFGEILPKSLAKMSAEKFSLKLSTFLYYVIKILYPITFVFYHIQRLMVKRLKTQTYEPTVTEDDLESIIDTMEEEGVLNSQDADLYQGVIDLNEKTVYEIMTPRVDAVCVSINDKSEQVLKVFSESGYSRLPVYEHDKDNMIGMINYKDFFPKYLENSDVKLKTLLIPTTYVAENMKVKELIRIMQKDKKHLAIVLDEHGGTSGIVTMEDALEEVVGEIYDEHDEGEEVALIKQLDPNTYELDAEIEIEDLFEKLEIEHLPETDYITVGGYLYELAENLPTLHQVIQTTVYDEQLGDDGEYVTKSVRLTFAITKLENNRIRKVILKTKTLSDEEGGQVATSSNT